MSHEPQDINELPDFDWYLDLFDGVHRTKLTKKNMSVIREYVVNINDPELRARYEYDPGSWYDYWQRIPYTDQLAAQNNMIKEQSIDETYNEPWMELERIILRACFAGLNRSIEDTAQRLQEQFGNMKARDDYMFALSLAGGSNEHFMRDGNAINHFQWNGKSPDRKIKTKKAPKLADQFKLIIEERAEDYPEYTPPRKVARTKTAKK